MATGKCVNIGKPCSKALKKYVIEADKTNFVCPECGGKLIACDGPVTDPDSLKKAGGTFTANNSDKDNSQKKNKLMYYVIGAVAVVAIVAVAVYFLIFPKPAPVVQIKGLEIADYDPMVWVDTTDTLTVVPTPADAKATYIWSSSNEAVATVIDGVVKVVGEGETTITVKVEGHEEISATAKLYAENSPGEIDVESMTFTETEKDMVLSPNTEKQLNIDCTPDNANEGVFWKSDNPNVATVSDKGLVKAIALGTSTITAETSRTHTTTSIKVTVKKGEGNKIDLGFATYEGDLKNGKPEGNGTMTFKTRHVIPGSKGDIVAEPGEYAVGTWRNGEVNLVTLHQNNGNKPIITHK